MKKKSLKINAILNAIKQMCAVIFPLITFPYISRVLKAENYGKISFGSSIVAYFSLIAALGITNYAIREGARLRNDKKSVQDFCNQIFTINILTTIISYVLLVGTLFWWKKLAGYQELIIVQSLIILFTTIGIDWLYGIYEDYLIITIRSIAVQMISFIMLFLFVKNQNDYIMYAAITIFASAGVSIFNFIYARKYVHINLTWNLNLKRHLPPMIILFCNTVMISIYANSGTTILGILKDDTTVGIYGVSTKIYIIVKYILSALIVVTLPRLSLYLSQDKMNEYHKLLKKIFDSLLLVVMPAVVGLFMLSKNAILIIAGTEYVSGTNSLRILCLALACAMFAGYFTTSILIPYRMEKKILLATLVSSATNLIINFILIPHLSLNGAAIATFVAEGIVAVMSIYFAREVLKLKIIDKSWIGITLGCIAVAIACELSKTFVKQNINQTLLAMATSSLLYFLIMVLTKNPIIMDILKNILKIYKTNKNTFS